MASRLANTAATTDAQPLMPQAHGTKAGAPSETRPSPSGDGRPMTNPKVRESPQRGQQNQDGARDDGLQERQNDDQVSGIDKHEAALPVQCHKLGQELHLKKRKKNGRSSVAGEMLNL